MLADVAIRRTRRGCRHWLRFTPLAGDPAAIRPRGHHEAPTSTPTYIETQVTCTCGNTFTTRSTASRRRDPRRGLLATATPSTPASRRSSTPAAASPVRARFGKRPRQVARRRRPLPVAGTAPSPCLARRRPCHCGSQALQPRPPGDRRVRSRSTSCSPSTPSSRRAGRPGGARRPGPRPARWASGTPSSTPIVRGRTTSWHRCADDLEAARELAAEDAVVRAPRPTELAVDRDAARRAAAAPARCRATPTTPRTSSSRSRRVRAARSRRCSPATCCGCTCATPSGRAGGPRCSTRPSPTSAATRT